MFHESLLVTLNIGIKYQIQSRNNVVSSNNPCLYSRCDVQAAGSVVFSADHLTAFGMGPYLAGCHSNSRIYSLLHGSCCLARGYYCVSPLPRITSAIHSESVVQFEKEAKCISAGRNSEGERETISVINVSFRSHFNKMTTYEQTCQFILHPKQKCTSFVSLQNIFYSRKDLFYVFWHE